MTRPSRTELGKVLRLEERLGYTFTDVRLAYRALHSFAEPALQVAGDRELASILAQLCLESRPALCQSRRALIRAIAHLQSNRVIGTICVERGIAMLAHVPEQKFQAMERSARKFYEICGDIFEAIVYMLRIDGLQSGRYEEVLYVFRSLFASYLAKLDHPHNGIDRNAVLCQASELLELRHDEQHACGELRIALSFLWPHGQKRVRKRRYVRDSDAFAARQRFLELVVALLDQHSFYTAHPWALKRMQGD